MELKPDGEMPTPEQRSTPSWRDTAEQEMGRLATEVLAGVGFIFEDDTNSLSGKRILAHDGRRYILGINVWGDGFGLQRIEYDENGHVKSIGTQAITGRRQEFRLRKRSSSPQ